MKVQSMCFLFFSLLLLVQSLVFALPSQINPPGEKLVLVDPREHAWGAYDSNGRLIRSGLASAGADWCEDMGQECHTSTGSFRVRSLGSKSCISPSFPLPSSAGTGSFSPTTPTVPEYRMSLPRPPDPKIDPANYLRDIHAVRERCSVVLKVALVNKLSHFEVDMDKFPDVAHYVVSIIKV